MTTPTTPNTWTVTIPAPTMHTTHTRTGKTRTRSPWLNTNDREHWAPRAQLTTTWRQLARHHTTQAQIPHLTHATIHAHIQRPTTIRHDIGNWYPTIKACIDGIVDAGVLDDDDTTHLDGPYLHPTTPGPPTVTLTITTLAFQTPIEDD